MFTGNDMIELRNAVRDYRKLSFMGDMNFICLNEHAEPNLVSFFVAKKERERLFDCQNLKKRFEQSSNWRDALRVC